jgi:hypothetical protein
MRALPFAVEAADTGEPVDRAARAVFAKSSPQGEHGYVWVAEKDLVGTPF